MFNICGYSVPLPDKLREVLTAKDWTTLQVKQLRDKEADKEQKYQTTAIILVLSCYDESLECVLPHVAQIRLDKEG